MKKNTMTKTIRITFVLMALLATMLSGCGREKEPAAVTAPPAPVATPEPVSTADPAEMLEGEAVVIPEAAEPAWHDGDRFEDVIVIEGMEETVRYEYVRNDALGFAMSYDYESLTRRSEPGRERFISVWDNADSPENYLEVTASTRDAETAAAAIAAELSQEYDIIQESRVLDRVGTCLHIDASEAKGGGGTPDRMQGVYVIPAPDGCRIATMHYGFEAAEGFGRRFRYMLNTFSVIDRAGDAVFADEQALAAVRNYCFAVNPDLKDIVKAEDYPAYWELASSDAQQIVVLFRSYTGAQVRYYVDRQTGETYVTEFVPGITDEEQRTDETFNVRNYL